MSLYFRCFFAYGDVPGFVCVFPEIGFEEVSGKLSILNGLCLERCAQSFSRGLSYRSAVVEFPVFFFLLWMVLDYNCDGMHSAVLFRDVIGPVPPCSYVSRQALVFSGLATDIWKNRSSVRVQIGWS